jgi:hypothetical protein
MASLDILFPSDTTLIAVSCCTTDDLPNHVKGVVEWGTLGAFTGYYLPAEFAKNKKPTPIEFINNGWHPLLFIESQQAFFTHPNQ